MGAGTKTKVVQSNFANGMVSPRLRWTTNEEIFRSSASKILNAKVGNYGEIYRREGLVTGEYATQENVYGFTVQDLYDGTAKRLLLIPGEGGGFAVVDSSEVLGSFETTTTVLSHKDMEKLTVIGRLRHANYGGEEYFCGKGQAPFKISLENGVLSAKLLVFEVPPFNDTVVGSEYKIYFKKVESDGVGYGIVVLPSSLRISSADSLKLINYDAASFCRKKLKYSAEGTAEAGNLPGWTSDLLPAYGNVTLKTEGSYWAGTITLYERMLLDDGTYEDVDLGQVVAGGLASTMNLTATITRLNSQVYAKATEFYDAVEYMKENGGAAPSDSYKDEGVTVSIQVSGTQEVFCFPRSGEIPADVVAVYPDVPSGYEVLVFRCDTQVTSLYEGSETEKGFTTNSFATSIIRASLNDYPRTICFFQDRLVFGGTDANPKRLFMSKTGNPMNFQLGVNDDDALSTTVSGSDLEEIRWLCPREGLLVGTSRREYALRGSTSAAVTPTSIKVSKPSGDSAYTSANVDCRNVESGVACVRGSALELLLYRYSSDTYTYVPTVMNALGKELFEAEGGIKDFTVCSRPETEVWVLFNSGRVANLRVTEAVKNGWTLMEFALGRVVGLFVTQEEGRDVPGFVIKDDNDVCRVGYFYSDALVLRDKSEPVKAYLIDKGMDGNVYTDFEAPNSLVTPFSTEIELHPWWTSANDAWGARVVPTKTCLCLCSARGFTASYSEDWVENDENVVFDATGARKPVSFAEYELRKQGRWDDKAKLTIRTDDNHEFVLSAVRTRLTVGES